ncbi:MULTISPECIES: undecaprenyldiphospho-muramoylpentapeptide beta-N-acetylglucosaminyltransferase [Rhizobium]|jgi:UDP-N-acetylglucosamine--N-acetylmuramyl-(pentapeptide) pyrophosphoryl-undecaprenol N-acetylglucosamine transferase|uniref:undecaprenyldiphospho-muramoylpentapeptide beta-N-acetylglucosaminyltransferase n=1 Tax=Rhizobium TaxID=379 RepID=UPI00037B7938|nr:MULTISPECIES: undecaprenyldiphospho-muramoylpentapeptide beta-N-acetylglucosaminyltransferase [Rhizobium]ASR11218.1 undecaprenyldiphospho-muramoylpentapeptide beta-N- acetylglucosaminyltransferase [Rhizobium leguminosarum bv. viciae]KAF5886015.1 undecaprenyldiphospho-muramoylpentapeptide beta-N-acetylglucosaminyltransferase [Rhizobium sp. PEPV16]MBY5769007.1 undecaprenyldiphospho-muramoylpentapeptide beta-N-acetylglucosaminyltransferase [Rhizobium leguminosarum]MBY5826492.1 undecaprenyldipho
MSNGIVLLAAGGTGGHVFPAEALAFKLKERGYSVHLVTDSRAERYAGKFPAEEIHVVPSATIGSKNPLAVARSLWTLWSGMRAAKKLIQRLQPVVVVGFGGYPTVPPLLAATRLGVPSMIHEQNAVMGRANKALATRVQAIAGGFLPEGSGAFPDKTVTTGNPVRPAIIAAAEVPYTPSHAGDAFNLVVFGGSQGAQYFSKTLPTAISLLDDALRVRLRITQQVRPEDMEMVSGCVAKLEMDADIAPFFTDMAERLARAHLVICRSGASTVSEISVIGRPAILVPYPHALDHDQAANAAALAAAGGAKVIAQSELSPEKIAAILTAVMNDPEKLAHMAAAAKLAGKPDAANLLADMVEAIAARRTIAEFKRTRA